MNSPLPKVLHPVAGQPMIRRVIEGAKKAGAKEVRVVLGFGENLVRPVIESLGATGFRQQNQWGTADAVRAAQPESLEGLVVILNGDHPLIESRDLEHFVKSFDQGSADLAVVSCELKEPGHYGRIVRHRDQVQAIVEARDASHDTLKVREINTGIYVLRAELLNELLPKIQSHNAQKEFYLTDLVSLALEEGLKVEAIKAPRHVAYGVNTQAELAKVTRKIFKRKARALLESGVILVDPSATYIEDEVEVGPGTVVYPGAFILGKTSIGRFCVLEPNVYIHSCEISDSVRLKGGSYLEDSKIGEGSQVGPYARLRPESSLGRETKVGNFVELKKARLGDRSKASHLTYLGDAEIGEDSNIGCGTITCNYAADRKKYKTKIGRGVFVGSDTQFVAPIEVGDGAVIGSGSTITKDVPAGGLAVARGRQRNIENYSPRSPAEVREVSAADKKSGEREK